MFCQFTTYSLKHFWTASLSTPSLVPKLAQTCSAYTNTLDAKLETPHTSWLNNATDCPRRTFLLPVLITHRRTASPANVAFFSLWDINYSILNYCRCHADTADTPRPALVSKLDLELAVAGVKRCRWQQQQENSLCLPERPAPARSPDNPNKPVLRILEETTSPIVRSLRTKWWGASSRRTEEHACESDAAAELIHEEDAAVVAHSLGKWLWAAAWVADGWLVLLRARDQTDLPRICSFAFIGAGHTRI